MLIKQTFLFTTAKKTLKIFKNVKVIADFYLYQFKLLYVIAIT